MTRIQVLATHVHAGFSVIIFVKCLWYLVVLQVKSVELTT